MTQLNQFKFKSGDVVGNMQILEQLCLYCGNDDKIIKSYKVRCEICEREKIINEYAIIRESGIAHRSCGNGLKGLDSNFYKVWYNMKQRCDNPCCKDFPNYGGRGLTHEFPYFIDFYDYLYESYIKHCVEHGRDQTSIERIDNDRGYLYGNICWATWEEQYNNRSNTIYFYYRSPEGQQGIGRNLGSFTRQRNLDIKGVFYYIDKYKPNYQGWYFERISKEEYQFTYAMRYRLELKTEEELLDLVKTSAIPIPRNSTKETIIECISLFAMQQRKWSELIVEPSTV